ncbi:hypothetical protein [Brevundimonas sp.]
MNRLLTMKRLSILFAVLFAVGVGGLVSYKALVTAPIDRCQAKGQWWYEEGRECVTPIYLPDITNRPAGQSRAEASAEKNRELVQIEDALAAQRRAAAADTARQREALDN